MTSTPATDQWLNVTHSLQPLEGAAGTAERLLLLAHYGVNFDGWISGYLSTYWDKLLPDRVITTAYQAQTLPQWWTALSEEISSAPRNSTERAEVAHHLEQASELVLHILRTETAALVLRARITSEAVRFARADNTEEAS